jgi:EpsD family peptidyl-prolyl cis-trans isomerase
MRRLTTVALILGLLSLAACRTEKLDESQILARVNSDELSIHQFNFALDKVLPRPIAQGERDALVEKLIDRQLAVQGAFSKSLDRRPEVMMRIEEARRDILAAAYAEDVAAVAQAPSNEAVASYYAEHPGVFAERKIYRLREITLPIDAPALGEAKQRLDRKDDLADVLVWLRQQPGSFGDQMVLRPAEQLPVEVADRLVRVRRGETVAFQLARGLVIYELQSAEPAPLSWKEAAPLINKHLKKQAEASLIANELKRLRSTAQISRNSITQKP